MINRLLVFIVLVPIIIFAQSDTIFTSDTTISSVRIINMSDNLLRYFYIDSNTLYTTNLRITSDNGLYRETINSNTGGESWNASNGWHRIIEISGGSGRGKCHFLIQTGGGSGTPCRVEAIVNTAWSNTNSTLTIIHNSYPNFITDIRVVRNATSNKSFVDIKGGGDDYVDVTILPDGSTNAAIINFTNVNSLPSNDTMEIHQTLTIMIKSMSTGKG